MKNFIKNHLKGLVLSSVVILIPMLFGLIIWNKLPDTLAIHFNPSGETDGFGGKAILVFLLPLILTLMQWFLVFVSTLDKSAADLSKKIIGLVLWIIPITSLYVGGIMYSIALGAEINFTLITGSFLGLLLIMIGNYMPKSKRNGIFGIRMLSTLSSDENWNKTHRLAGKLAVIGGVTILILSVVCFKLKPEIVLFAVLVPIMLISLLSPVIYSQILYHKQLKRNEITINKTGDDLKKHRKKSALIAALIIAVSFILCAFLLFTGDISFELNENEFSIVADFYEDLTVKYEDVDSIELRVSEDRGSRVFGYGSPKLLMGNFKNEEFGNYTRYSYTKCENEIAIFSNGHVLVISGETEDKTTEIYNILIEKCNGN